MYDLLLLSVNLKLLFRMKCVGKHCLEIACMARKKRFNIVWSRKAWTIWIVFLNTFSMYICIKLCKQCEQSISSVLTNALAATDFLVQIQTAYVCSCIIRNVNIWIKTMAFRIMHFIWAPARLLFIHSSWCWLRQLIKCISFKYVSDDEFFSISLI